MVVNGFRVSENNTGRHLEKVRCKPLIGFHEQDENGEWGGEKQLSKIVCSPGWTVTYD